MSGKGKGGRGKKKGKSTSRSAKAGLQFPVGRIARSITWSFYQWRIIIIKSITIEPTNSPTIFRHSYNGIENQIW